MEAEAVAAHQDPIWRAKADFLIQVDLAPWGLSGRFEQLWARQVEPSLFELCCVPFLPYGFHLGDVVETATVNGRPFMVKRVVRPSNRLNIRVVVENPDDVEAVMPRLLKALEDSRSQVEIYEPGYVAADVPSEASERFLLRELYDLVSSKRVTIEKI